MRNSWIAMALVAMSSLTVIAEGKDSFIAKSEYLEAEISLLRPQFLALSVDSLGHGKFRTDTLQPSLAAAGAQENDAKRTDSGVEYHRKGVAASTPARWTIRLDTNGFTLISRWSESDPPEPIVLEFNPKLSRATLLGTFNPDGSVRLPAILHLPAQGTARISAIDDEKAALGYDAARTGEGFIKVTFPPPIRIAHASNTASKS